MVLTHLAYKAPHGAHGLCDYNLPPWLAIKKGHLLLSLIVPGKHKVKNMDVYLAPLIEELETLWTGVLVIDMSQTPTRRAAND